MRGEAAARLGCGQIPVCLGATDSVVGALGLGVRHPGQVAYIAGTSNVIMGVADRLVTNPGHRFLVTPQARVAITLSPPPRQQDPRNRGYLDNAGTMAAGSARTDPASPASRRSAVVT